MTQYTVDVSQYDRDRKGSPLDWDEIRTSGIAGMCARATYGDPSGVHYDTQRFAEFMDGARSAGFEILGAYHNLVKGDQASINRQVDWLRSEMDSHRAGWAMLDVERYERLVENDMWPRFADARRFADRWHDLEDRVLVFYIPGWMWSEHLGRPDLTLLQGVLVESDYDSNGINNRAGPFATVYRDAGGDSGRGWQPYGGVTPGLWQFGSELAVPGASGVTDVNAFRGTYAELKALLLPAGPRTYEASVHTLARGFAFAAGGALLDVSQLTVLSLPPVGAPGRSDTGYLSFSTDAVGVVPDVELRVAFHNGARWEVVTVTVAPGARVSWRGPGQSNRLDAANGDGCTVSIGRVKRTTDTGGGADLVPVSVLFEQY